MPRDLDGDGLVSNTGISVTATLTMPLLCAFGVMASFKIAGPIWRLEKFLTEVRDGKQPNDCRLRDGDEMQDFCRLVNQATAPLRQRYSSAVDERGIAAMTDAVPSLVRPQQGVRETQRTESADTTAKSS